MFSKYDFLIWAIIIVIALGGIIIYRQISCYGADEVYIMVDGEEYETIPLNKEKEDNYREIKGVNGDTIIEIKQGQVRAVQSACPDKICIHYGWISKPGQMIVCLPNRVVVKIISSQEQDIDLYTN